MTDNFKTRWNMKKLILILIILLIPSVCAAKTMYKCASGNRVDYQFKPCAGEAKQEVIEDQPPSEEKADAGETAGDGIVLGEFSVQTEETSGDYQYFAYKVMVSNRTNTTRKVSLKYKAVDASGFEIDYILLSGTIQANSYENLTGRSLFAPNKYNRINKWVLDK